MKMILEIFENNEKMGEIITTKEAEIYKRLAQIYFIKDNKKEPITLKDIVVKKTGVSRQRKKGIL